MSIEKELKLVKGDVAIEAQALSERLKRAVSSALPFDLTIKSNIEYYFDEDPRIVKYIVEDEGGVVWGWMHAIDTINLYKDNEKVMEIFIDYNAEFVESKELYIKLLEINKIEIEVVE